MKNVEAMHCTEVSDSCRWGNEGMHGTMVYLCDE